MYTSPPPPGAGGPPPYYAPPRLHLAEWWPRVGAQLIDNLIVCAGAVVLFVVFGGFVGAGFVLGDATGTVALILGVLAWLGCVIAVSLIYAPVMMARTNGKTVGRMALGLRVVRVDGRPVDFGYALLREAVIKHILFGWVTGGIGTLLDCLWPLWDEQNRALHDMIVDSRVVVDRT